MVTKHETEDVSGHCIVVIWAILTEERESIPLSMVQKHPKK